MKNLTKKDKRKSLKVSWNKRNEQLKPEAEKQKGDENKSKQGIESKAKPNQDITPNNGEKLQDDFIFTFDPIFLSNRWEKYNKFTLV